MKRWLRLAALALVLTPLAANTEDRPTFDGLWQLANSKPGHQTIDEGRVIRIVVPDEHIIYFFTRAGQPEHPAVFKRSIVQDGDKIFVKTDGWSFGDASAQAAFERVKAQFEAQDAQMRQQMQKKP